MSRRFVLASSSPRRRELFKLITEDFEVLALDVDETTFETDPVKLVMVLAEKKATETAAHVNETQVVIGADTVVVQDGVVLGKPKDAADAIEMLKKLSDNCHDVYTGYCIIDQASGKKKVDYTRTTVTFAAMTDQEICDYVATNEPMDKAGAYGIQGYGAKYILGISGDYFTVMGFPVHDIYSALKDMNVL